MRYYLLILLAVCIGCAGANSNISKTVPPPLKDQLYELLKNNKLENNLALLDIGGISAIPMTEEEKKGIEFHFSRQLEVINRIDESLNNGCYPLLEDIEESKYPCINKESLKIYPNLDWATRNIGFKNWIKSMRGALLLQQAEKVKYQIILMQLVNEREFSTAIQEQKREYDKLMMKIREENMSKNWVD